MEFVRKDKANNDKVRKERGEKIEKNRRAARKAVAKEKCQQPVCRKHPADVGQDKNVGKAGKGRTEAAAKAVPQQRQ